MGALQASGKEWGQSSSDEEIVDTARESLVAGVNLIETAEEYGKGYSEQVVGKALKEVGRDNFVVATEVFGQHLRYEEKLAPASIRRWGVTEIDLYQVHWADPWEQIPLRHTFRALEKLYDQEK